MACPYTVFSPFPEHTMNVHLDSGGIMVMPWHGPTIYSSGVWEYVVINSMTQAIHNVTSYVIRNSGL